MNMRIERVERTAAQLVCTLLLTSCAAPQVVGAGSAHARVRALPVPVASAAPATDHCTQLEPLFMPLIAGHWIASASVAWMSADSTELCSFGRTVDSVKATPDTLYEVGSLTKLFTGVLLASMVTRNRVQLDEPLAPLLPPGAQPSVNGRRITLFDLATHHSGLPRMPDNFEPKNPADPYADYDEARLFDFISKVKLAPAGAQHLYSNVGAALLGQALARREGVSYSELLRLEVLEPLGMTDTRFGMPPDNDAHSSRGHDADGALRPAWHFDALAPAGALVSSARDMARFVRAALFPESSPLTAAFELAERPRAAASAGRQIGLFFQTRSDGSLWHNGETGGFASYFALDRDRRVGVTLLLSSTFARSDELGDRVLAYARGEPLVPLELPPSIALDYEGASTYEGNYVLSSEFAIRVFRDAGALYAQATAQQPFRMWPSGVDRFYLRGVDARLEFERNAAGQANALVLDQGGARHRGVRR